MKKVFILLTITMILACSDNEQVGTIISILEDKTDNFEVSPKYEDIRATLNIEADIWQGITFRYGTLTGLSINSKKEFVLTQEHSLLGNELERKQLVQSFQKDVQKLLQEDNAKPVHEYSALFEPIVEELYRLQVRKQISTLYVYTDLQENSRWFSVYNAKDYELLHQKQKQVLKLFLKKSKNLQSTTNIKVVVVFQPKNREEDFAYQTMQKVYKKVFEEIGISISFVANIN